MKIEVYTRWIEKNVANRATKLSCTAMVGNFEKNILVSLILLSWINHLADTEKNSVSEERITSHQYIPEENTTTPKPITSTYSGNEKTTTLFHSVQEENMSASKIITSTYSAKEKTTTPFYSVHEENLTTPKSNMSTEKVSVKEKATTSFHPVSNRSLTTPKSDMDIKKDFLERGNISTHHQVDEEILTPFPPAKITRGKNGIVPAGYDEFRHIVLIQEFRTWKHRGAGTLFFGNRWILTTRSVLADVDRVESDDQPGENRFTIKRTFEVGVLPKYTNKRTELITERPFWSMKTFCHPFLGEKNEEKEFTDIGLIKLSHDIKTIGMGERVGFESLELIVEDVDLSREKLQIAGWGVFDTQHSETTLSDDLMTVEMSVLTDCPNATKLYKPSAHLCSHLKDYNICSGDSGGPAVWISPDADSRRYLAGVIGSSDQEKCRGNSIIMNVTHFRDFIDYVRRHEPSEYECMNMVNKTSFRPITFRKFGRASP